MNRLTAIGLASLVAYGLLIGTKYAGFVAAARDDKSSPLASVSLSDGPQALSEVVPVNPSPAARPLNLPPPVPRLEPARASAAALEYRASRDLKAYTDGLLARRNTLTADERYNLAKALEECQFVMNLNEDLGAYSARQRRQFLSGLPNGDALNAKRVAAYDAVDSSQRCQRFQGSKIFAKDVEDLFLNAAQQGDPRAQGRLLVAELNKNLNNANRGEGAQAARVPVDDFSRIIGLLESQDPEAVLIVGQFLAQSALTSQIRVGPNNEAPEPSAFLGAFSLVACDLGPDCVTLNRELQNACAYGGYCNAQTFEELYQNFLASPFSYAQAIRYRQYIYTAISTHNWALIGLLPPSSAQVSP